MIKSLKNHIKKLKEKKNYHLTSLGEFLEVVMDLELQILLQHSSLLWGKEKKKYIYIRNNIRHRTKLQSTHQLAVPTDPKLFSYIAMNNQLPGINSSI